jgi:ubiquinone/menaquinone biosynthesis C-methylase UbiE
LGIKVGVEPSAAMRGIAQKRGIEAIDGAAEALPFHDSCFDIALMVTTVCFLDDMKAAFQEANRVLWPNGCLLIGLIDKESPIGKSYQANKDKSVFYSAATFYSVDEIVSLLKQTGFGSFCFAQTIFHSLADLKDVEPVKDGYGEGSFVVIRAVKHGF